MNGAVAVPLTRGMTAWVDAEDADRVLSHRWRSAKSHATFYALRTVTVAGRELTVYLHRFILGLSPGDGVEVDHWDNNGLNNTRDNLRACTHAENKRNTLSRTGSSKFKGVCWDKRCGKWKASLHTGGKTVNLGRYTVEEDAARAYDDRAVALFGQYARINFPNNTGPHE